MRVKDIVAEDFLNYRLPSMFIITAVCDWKCCTELGLGIRACQNSPLASSPTKEIPDEAIYRMYASDDITRAVVLGGLEPFLQIDEVISLISLFRQSGEGCPFIIYTGYNRSEVASELSGLCQFANIIVKFGRYIPNRPHRYDPLLGVKLVSENQYAEQIS